MRIYVRGCIEVECSSSELLPTPNGAKPMMMWTNKSSLSASHRHVGLDGVDNKVHTDGTGILLSQSHIEEMKRALPHFRYNDSP